MGLRIDIVTLFPEIFEGPLGSSIVGRARKENIVEINTVDLRDFTHDRHRTVDDKPYGGGPGMLMKIEPLYERFTQSAARELSGESHLIILCGHYEGVDERVRLSLVDREFSIGDYILTSGNLPAMVMADAITRLLPGALGDPESDRDESFENGLLEYPQYTRPPEFNGWNVPEILLSGNHAEIEKWRREESLKSTLSKRPDLL